MKTLLQGILILATIKSFGQENEVIVKGDSLIVRDESIATNPFNFGRDPLEHLKSKMKLPKPTIEIHTVANRHVDNDVDTIYSLKFGQDSFEVYKWDKEDIGLMYSEIKTDRFATKHGIRIGMTKSQVKSILKDYDVRIIPKYLILENTEIIEYLKLEFSKDTLKRIEFQGYFD
jgi:hypothetical protein